MNRLHALMSLRIRTSDGRLLGRAHDLRCEWQAGHARVTHLVYGRRGMLERLGFHERLDTLPWSAVRSIGDEIVVDAGEVRRP
jgi:sporulation protein YlmC with PRC-barrel domain